MYLLDSVNLHPAKLEHIQFDFSDVVPYNNTDAEHSQFSPANLQVTVQRMCIAPFLYQKVGSFLLPVHRKYIK